MGKIFLLLCVLALSFAYVDPPIAEVMGHNLDTGFLDSLMNKVPEDLVLTNNNPVYLNATLIGVFPSVEDRIPADPSPYAHKILWSWGENYSTYIYRDFKVDSNTCKDVPLVIDPEQTIYSFRIFVNNISSVHYDDPPIEIKSFDFPLTPVQLEQINATEKIEVRLEYRGEYHYVNGDGCYGPVEALIQIYEQSTLYYYVENGNVIFFTARPVLGEQWFQNNHFDNLIFSKKKFYKTEAYLDGNKTGTAHIYNFSIYNDSLGTMFINASRENNYTNASLDEYNEVYTPTPLLRENETFRYLYEENYTYEGIGYHNLTIVVTDHFLHNYTYNKTLLSRALSPGELSETNLSGLLAGNNTQNITRPNYVEPPQQLNQILIPTGALAVIFIVIALAGWWGYSRGRTLD